MSAKGAIEQALVASPPATKEAALETCIAVCQAQHVNVKQFTEWFQVHGDYLMRRYGQAVPTLGEVA